MANEIIVMIVSSIAVIVSAIIKVVVKERMDKEQQVRQINAVQGMAIQIQMKEDSSDNLLENAR